ncbi:MAG: hypothetical protein NC489_39150 [Ruminococcus flavefaciens]|nr:hypothetical protein [Ruminococcus flavefaciens]
MPVQITKHGADRLRGRIGLSKKALQRAADTAFEKGVRHSETSGNLNKWVTGLFFSNPMANNIRLYNDKAWIFAGKTLVTVIQVPASLKKSLKDAIDRKKAKGHPEDALCSAGKDVVDSTDNITVGEESTE